MAFFRPLPALSCKIFYTKCQGPVCTTRDKAPGEHGRVRCAPKLISEGPQRGRSVATLEWACSDYCAALADEQA
eukprot:1150389-Pelagomonas_calceolata.AAC.7